MTKVIHNQKDTVKPKILVILGTTSSGKTALGVKLAANLGGEIVSADSRQVYKGMDVGTGKDLAEYKVGGKKISYHLIDVASPKSRFDLAKYQTMASKVIEKILKRGRLPIVVGGSGLYLQALVDNYQLEGAKSDGQKRTIWEKWPAAKLFAKISALKPDFAARINNSDKNNPRRLARYLEIIRQGALETVGKKVSPYDWLIIGLSCPEKILRERIHQRLIRRLEKEKLAEEVKRLHRSGVSWERLAAFGLEYKFVSQFLRGHLSYEEMTEKLNRAIYKFAKRQKTWFRRWEKQGAKIKWLADPAGAEKIIRKWL